MTNYTNRESAHAEAMLRGADCTKCPLYGCQRGPVMPEIRPGKRLLVITESPSKDDVRAGAHLVDRAGQEFAQGLREGGYVREDVSITSVVLCQPPPGWNLEDLLGAVTKKNKQLTQELVTAKQRGETAAVPEMLQSPVVACAGRLTRDIAESGATTYLALGGKALQSVAHAYDIPFAREPNAQGQFISNVSEQAGAPVQLPDGKILCSSWHPWYGMSDKRHLLPLIRKYIARAAEIVQRGRVNWAWVPDDACPSTFEEHLAFIERLIVERAVVVCDIETDGIALSKATAIRCIGLGSFLRLRSGQVGNAVDKIISPPGYTYVTSSVPLVTRLGAQWWPAEQLEQLLDALRRLFRQNRCMFHNGLFDTGMLKAHGLWPELQTWADTMVAHHCTRWTDHRHRLSDLGRQYTEAPLWKKMVDHKEAEGDVSDDILHRYNRYDVQVTAVAGLEIFKELQSDDTFAQYQTDEKLAPIARDMSMRGLWIDEQERGRLSLAYNALEFGLIKKWVKLVGAPINPRSGAQVAEWLFGKNGLTPPLATDGEEFEDGDDPAVSIPALFTLQDQGLPPHVAEAVQCLLDIKAVSKARTSYVDFKHRMESAGGPEVPAVHAGRWNFKNTKRGARMQVKWEEALPKRTAASRLFANWQLHVVPSGRWSSSPNVQNIPKKIWELYNADTGKSEVQYGRKMFVCPPGHVMVQADYEQIELRVYAAVTGDGYSIAALDQNLDPHLLAAAIITAPTDEGVMEQFALLRDWRAGKGTPAQKKLAEFYRGAAKTVRYLKNYGGGGEKLYDSMRTLRNKTTNKRLFPELNGATGKKLVTEWEKRWDARQTETAAWHRSVGAAVRRYEYTQSPIGDKRKRYFPDGPSKVNAPPNHIIQASAAYICNQAMLKLAEAIPFGSWSEETGICLQVHDYIAMYVPQERALEAAEILKKCMYYEMEYEGGAMPFPATPIISRNWADGDEQIPWEQDLWDAW